MKVKCLLEDKRENERIYNETKRKQLNLAETCCEINT